MANDLTMWSVYFNPTDHPGKYVARRFVSRDGEPVPTEDIVVSNSLEHIRIGMQAIGLICFPRSDGDEPQIVETWM